MKHIPSIFPIFSFRDIDGELTVLPLILCINVIKRFLDADVLYVFVKMSVKRHRSLLLNNVAGLTFSPVLPI